MLAIVHETFDAIQEYSLLSDRIDLDLSQAAYEGADHCIQSGNETIQGCCALLMKHCVSLFVHSSSS